jgi:hypothetical protein
MKRLVLIAAPLAMALAGCNSDQSAAPASVSAMTPSGVTRPPGGPNLAAERICVKAVQQQTNALGVAILSSEFSQAATVVMLGFPDAQAPWRCLVTSDGRVSEVTYTGSEGRL